MTKKIRRVKKSSFSVKTLEICLHWVGKYLISKTNSLPLGVLRYEIYKGNVPGTRTLKVEGQNFYFRETYSKYFLSGMRKSVLKEFVFNRCIKNLQDISLTAHSRIRT